MPCLSVKQPDYLRKQRIIEAVSRYVYIVFTVEYINLKGMVIYLSTTLRRDEYHNRFQYKILSSILLHW